MLTLLFGSAGIYLLALSGARYLKIKSWEKIRDNVFLGVINLNLLLLAAGYEYGFDVPLLTALVYVVLGLLSIYFTAVITETLKRTRSWGFVRKKANYVLFSVSVMFIFGPFSFPEDSSMLWQIVWVVIAFLLELLSLWNFIWPIVAKKDTPAISTYIAGMPLALFMGCLIMAYKEFFGK